MDPTDPHAEHVVAVRDGVRVRVRPIRPEDKDRIVEGMERLSSESRYRRFLRPVTRLSDRELQYLTEIDYTDHFAWAAEAIDAPGSPGVGISRYVRDPRDPQTAEAAVAVVDDYQELGVGSLLLRLIARSAIANGIVSFTGWVLAENHAMLDPLARAGAEMQSDEGIIRIRIPLPREDEDFNSSALGRAFRAAAAESPPVEPIR